jgi:hypothetical protein
VRKEQEKFVETERREGEGVDGKKGTITRGSFMAQKTEKIRETEARGTNPIRRPWTITCRVGDEISIMFFPHNPVQLNGSHI